MRCSRFSVFGLVLSLAFFFAFFINVNNVSAIDDLVITDTSTDICGGDCYQAGYRYFSVSDPDFWINQSNLRRLEFGITCGNSVCTQIFNSYSSFSVFEILPNYVLKSVRFYSVSNHQPLTVTLSDSLPGCPICEECQVCPDIPENPYDDKFDKIIVAIYTCGAILLVIYFFYCIYRMIIKSTGSNQ